MTSRASLVRLHTELPTILLPRAVYAMANEIKRLPNMFVVVLFEAG